MALNFNTNPYYDDFDEDKNFHRILFRPGRAVQARELTQSQTILQNQIDRFGKHIFKEGSIVTGGETFDEDAISVKLQPTFGNTTIDISTYDGYFALANSSNAIYKIKKAEVADSVDPNTLLVKFIKTSGISSLNSNGSIANSETLRIYSTADLAPANLVGNVLTSSTESSTIGRVFSIAEGVFFTNGIFVKNASQTVTISKYSNNANVTVGFDVAESIVSSSSDSSLLDPAIGASNYIAPGADRYKVSLSLSAKEIDPNQSIPDLTSEKYIEIARYRNGELVKNVQKTEYSVLEKTLARRTFDESGNYRVEGLEPRVAPEKFTDTANTTFVLDVSPGKAYIRGYEVEPISVTSLIINKARDTETVSGYDVPAYYGNYFYVTTANGAVINFSTAEKLELHRNTGSFSASTKIAEAYPKNLEYVSGNGSTSVYKLHLFNIVKTSNTPIDLTRCIIAGNATSVNATCNIDSSSTIVRTINGSNYSYSNVINLASSTGVTVGMEVSGANIVFPTHVIAINGNDITVSQNPVGNNSLGNTSLTFRSAYLTDTSYDSSVFEASYDVIKQFSQVNYNAKRVFKSVSFVAGVASVQTNDGTERFKDVSGANLQRNYAICIRTGGTGSFPNFTWVNLSAGSYISVPSPSVGSPATLNINLGDATFNGTADILTTLDITAAVRRTKTLSSNNIKYFTVLDSANTFSLGYADVIDVSAIYIATGSNTASNANVNVVGSFDVDLGQRDSFYDHATIKLKTGASVNLGNTMVVFSRYTHSGTGFFDTQSYPSYNTIPSYTKTNGTIIDLRDSIDFRPIRVANTTSNVYSNLSMSFSSQQIVDSVIGSVDTDLEYYLGRTDKIVVKSDESFKVIEGVSAATNPPVPNDEVDAMTLCTLTIQPYTYEVSNVSLNIQNNRRYTMKDIGAIDNRLTRVEYYTALNLLEKDIATTTYYDDNNNQLFNNGFIVDPFKGHGIGDVFNPDYKCSIDFDNEILRPRFESNGTSLTVSSNTLAVTSNLLTLTYTSVPYITQNVASGTTNVNPFNVIGFIGYVKLPKDTGTWVNFNKRPDVVVNKNKNLDNYVYSNNFIGSAWNNWSVLGYPDDNIVVYTYYSTSGQALNSTTDGRIKNEDSAIVEDKIYVYSANNVINFELFGMRPNTEMTLYVDSRHIGSYLRNYNVSSNTYTTEALVTNTNGYAKGQFTLPFDDDNKFVAGEKHLYFCDNRLSMENVTTFAETYFYTAFPKKKKKKKKKKKPVTNLTVIGGDPTVGPPAPGIYIDSSDPTYTTSVAVGAAAATGGTRINGTSDFKKAVQDLTGSAWTSTDAGTASTRASAANDVIVNLYKNELGRLPDKDGHNYWVSVAASGVSTEKLTEAFKAAAKENNEKCQNGDPLAQTFFVNEFTNPNGIFVSSIDLYFATKDISGIPVEVELRPSVNGFPDSENVIPGSRVTLNPSQVNLPVTANTPVATRFTFDSPIYLEPDEYSFVVMAQSDAYNVYVGTVGQQRIDGTGPIVSQPYIGSFFKSQNASTWTPEQSTDICFVLNKCEFATNTNQTAVLTPVALGYDQTYDVAKVSIPFDTVAAAANISFDLSTKNNGAEVLSDYVGIIPNRNISLDQRKTINAATDANVKIRMITTNSDISPYVDVSSSNYIVIKNLLESSASANVVSFPETLSSGGGALSKYITRKVTLNDGFDATSLRVYLQENLPQGSSIQVYYRVQAATDSDKLENKPWTLMTQTNVSSTNQNPTEYYDYEYKVNGVSYTSGGVTYTNFRTFAIKIVLYSTNPANAPTAKNLRAIALS
jgi:hypothetical protein